MFHRVFIYGVLGQVWYFIVSIPDLCLRPYFYLKKNNTPLPQSFEYWCVTYEGRSIYTCNENRLNIQTFIFVRNVITFIKSSASWLRNCKIAVAQLLS